MAALLRFRKRPRLRQVGLWCDKHRQFVVGQWPEPCIETSCKWEPVYRKVG